ncbi:MAG: serine hydrolase [Prolixibacteraceae bacterium]|nr:serine hydrolase [Prolixibacteraceae bacterium]
MRILSLHLIVIFTLFLIWHKPITAVTTGKDNVSNISDAAQFKRLLDSALVYLEKECGKDGIEKMLILKNGSTVYKGTGSEIVQPVWSCTKSFTSTVLGLLIAEKKCNLDDRVCDYVPEMKDHYPELTFRHFSTMTSGYRAEGDEPQGTYIHGPSRTPFIPSSTPLFAPGTEFRYWDSAMNMFGYCLTRVAGRPLEDIFREQIAEKIGMDPEKWDWKDFGEVNGMVVNGGAGNHSKGMTISATEFAKFGQLFLQEGKWRGRQIIPKRWVKEASSPQIYKIIPNDETPYGFNWWTAQSFPGASSGTYAAKGFNNNKCIVIPEWNMVISRLGLDGNIDDEKWGNFLRILSGAF